MVKIPVSVGELVDKLTILEIKRARMSDPIKVRNVATEYALLQAVLEGAVTTSPLVVVLMAQLQHLNQQLWEVEDALRLAESEQRFDERFVALARSVYKLNDQRAATKRAINELVGSPLMEEKSYAA